MFIDATRSLLAEGDASVAALLLGRMFAAGIAVVWRQPEFDERVAKLANVFLARHMGRTSVVIRSLVGEDTLDNIAAALAGRLRRHGGTVCDGCVPGDAGRGAGVVCSIAPD